jgi:sorting nexin-7/30
MEELNDKTVCADTDLRADMERWHKNKQKDLKELFISVADRQIKYYEKVRDKL